MKGNHWKAASALCAAGLALGLSSAVWSGAAGAQSVGEQELDEIGQMDWVREPGRYAVPGVDASVSIEQDEILVRGEQAERFLAIAEGHDRNRADALVVRRSGPQVIYDYVDMGHIRMDDWESQIDPDDLMQAIKAQTRKDNELRGEGHPILYVDGWAEKPRLDREKAVVYWAIRLRTNTGRKVMNARALKLGREGFTAVTWVGESSAFEGAQSNLRPALAAYAFDDGWTYADFKPGVDAAAAVGVGALAYRMMTGESASKVGGKAGAGIAAAIAAFFKKAWLLLLLPFYFVWVGIKRLFGSGGQ